MGHEDYGWNLVFILCVPVPISGAENNTVNKRDKVSVLRTLDKGTKCGDSRPHFLRSRLLSSTQYRASMEIQALYYPGLLVTALYKILKSLHWRDCLLTWWKVKWAQRLGRNPDFKITWSLPYVNETSYHSLPQHSPGLFRFHLETRNLL